MAGDDDNNNDDDDTLPVEETEEDDPVRIDVRIVSSKPVVLIISSNANVRVEHFEADADEE